jgi:alpha-ketoglutarate-dependent taurine dioxygenase
MQPTVTPLDATLGARITDVDLSNMDDAAWKVVEDAFHKYGALVFPGQHIESDAQVDFAKRFGNLETVTADGKPTAVAISNKTEDGSVLKADDFRYKTLRGNEGWHTDSSYMPLAAKASILSAQVVPPAGGETEVADMRAAYDELSQEMKDKISDLEAYHSLYQSQAKKGYKIETGSAYGYHSKGAPRRPLVKVHPVTGRKSLFIGRHAYEIVGMEREEGQKLLNELVDFACQAPRTYSHKWQPGDVLMWDNRCVLHRAMPYDYGEVRVLRHTRVAGENDSELVPTGRDELAADFIPSDSNQNDYYDTESAKSTPIVNR